MRKTILLVTSLLLLSCEMKVSKTAKQDAEMEKKQSVEKLSFPMENKFDEKYLLDNFWKCNYDSAGEEFAYSIILPKYVKSTSVIPIKTVGGLTNIGIYNTIGNKNKYVEAWIGYEKVKESMQPADWLKSKLNLSGETILNQNIITADNGEQYLDVLTEKPTKDENIISRFTVLREDNYYYLSKVSCNKNDYPDLLETVQHISHTIRLK